MPPSALGLSHTVLRKEAKVSTGLPLSDIKEGQNVCHVGCQKEMIIEVSFLIAKTKRFFFSRKYIDPQVPMFS